MSVSNDLLYNNITDSIKYVYLEGLLLGLANSLFDNVILGSVLVTSHARGYFMRFMAKSCRHQLSL